MQEPEVADAVQLFHIISFTAPKGYVERAHTSSVLPGNHSVGWCAAQHLTLVSKQAFQSPSGIFITLFQLGPFY